MKPLVFIFLSAILSITAVAQKQAAASKPIPIPTHTYNNLRDSCTSLDIVFLTGRGGSLSLDGRNVKFFTSFMTMQPANKKLTDKQDGTIMWEKQGREYLSGNMYFTSDSSGYIMFSKDGKDYVNALNKQGAGFLQTHGR